ncbi:MAG: hypothetical protein ACI8PZ_004105 [Myxococcota bacterium]|jgi:hypothetical protein
MTAPTRPAWSPARALRFLCTFGTLGALVGCTQNLERGWSGELDCGPDTVPIDVDFALYKTAGDEFEGSGELSWYNEGYSFQIDFGIGINLEVEPFGGDTREVLIELWDCEDSSGEELDCSYIRDGLYHTDDETIEGELVNFLGEFDCEVEVR